MNFKCTVMCNAFLFSSHVNCFKFYKPALSSVGIQGTLVKSWSVIAAYNSTS